MLRHLHSTSAALVRHHAGISEFNSGLQRTSRNILKETKISREHITPEIALRLITPECRLFHEPVTATSEKIFQNDPFWGFYWPGGQALSRYILDNPEIVAGKSILDVGSGCGASSLAAVMMNAKYAVANDIDEAAGCAALLNADLNNLPRERIKLCTDNLIGSTAIKEQIIFLGDVFYDEDFAALLLPWLQCLHAEGRQIFVGDPGRHGLTKGRLSFMHKLATYELTQNCCIENNGFKFVNVWRFK